MNTNLLCGIWLGIGTSLLVPAAMTAAEIPLASLPAELHWSSSPPLLTARAVDGWPWHSIKDPSIVQADDRWHLFATVRGSERSHAILYCSFADWSEADAAPRRILPNHKGYFCAPQVFWFRPHRKWYLICQATDESWGPSPFRPAFATTETISDPDSWSPLQPLYDSKPSNLKGWIDFWVICDDARAYLFFTSNDGKMWRSQTSLAEFPRGFSEPVLCLEADIFEASHTYRLRGRPDRYLTLIEAQNGHGWRYYKAYTADRLDGDWTPLAATKDQAFASMRNVVQPEGRWTDSISHGELIRSSHDERLEIAPEHLLFLYQGVSEADRRGKAYGEIPWQLGTLTPVTP